MSGKQLALVGATIYVDAAADAIRNGVVLDDGDTITGVGRVDIPENADCHPECRRAAQDDPDV